MPKKKKPAKNKAIELASIVMDEPFVSEGAIFYDDPDMTADESGAPADPAELARLRKSVIDTGTRVVLATLMRDAKGRECHEAGKLSQDVLDAIIPDLAYWRAIEDVGQGVIAAGYPHTGKQIVGAAKDCEREFREMMIDNRKKAAIVRAIQEQIALQEDEDIPEYLN